MLRRLTLLIGVAILVSACADTSAPTSAALAPISDDGQATVHIIFPCQITDAILPGVKGDLNIVIDGKTVGTITSCQHRSVSISPGRHTIRLATKGFDFGDVFGGPTFNVPSGAFYLYARGDGNTNWPLYETDVGTGTRMIASLKK